MTKAQLTQLTLARARLEAIFDEIRAGISALRPPTRTGESALFMASATAVIGLALVLVRGTTVQLPDVQFVAPAAPRISLAAWKVPEDPAPTAGPKKAEHRNEPPPNVAVFARSPLPREEGIRMVVATAHKLIGRPYRYGAAGPGAFDCSGFTSYVWRTAGIELPHNSSAQYGSLPHVSVDDLQPGDLVFSGSGGIGHVGLYVGGGRMINSPETGRSVEIEPLRGNLIGAARPALLLAPEKRSS